MNDTAGLLWTVLFSALGLGYLTYGRRQQALTPLLCGLALMIYPYFVHNVWLLVGIGAALLAVPWVYRG